jgi:hypothetical protein
VYYVYTLQFPNGSVFYVGKGTGNRIGVHETEARANIPMGNRHKIELIQAIWESGWDVVRTKVATFEREEDALVYEWGLMNMHVRAADLANILRPTKVAPLTLPRQYGVEGRRACLGFPARRSYKDEHLVEYHQVSDLVSFAKEHHIPLRNFPDLLDGKVAIYHKWRLISNCAHQP